MANHGNIQHTLVIVAEPDQVAEGDRIFRSHAKWMESTHDRDGERALLSYNVSKGPHLADPLDLDSATGGTCFVLSEVYASEAGVDDHLRQAMTGWEDFEALGRWMARCDVRAVRSAKIFNSLW
ncbi:MAG: hypothetical protein ACODAE_06025 [Gemmatimonadota bacterium]